MLGRIRRSSSIGSERAPRIDRSGELLTSSELDLELDLQPGPPAARLPPASSTLLPSPRPRFSTLQGMLLKRHRSSKWTKWGRRWFEVDDYRRTLSYYATEVKAYHERPSCVLQAAPRPRPASILRAADSAPPCLPARAPPRAQCARPRVPRAVRRRL